MAVPSMRTVVSAGCRSRRELEVAEAHHRQPPAARDAARLRFGDHAVRQQVGAAEHRVDLGLGRQQLARRGAAALERGGAGTTTTRHGRQAERQRRGQKASCRRVARSSSPATTASRRRPLACRNRPLRRPPTFLVREAHQHVDRRGRQVPGLDHRNAAGQQALPPFGRMHDAGEHDAVGPPADDGVEQRVFARIDIAALAQHQLVAGLGQRFGERLHGLQEDRAGDGGHHGRHQPAAVEASPPASRLGT
jgi:hypothetical protein